MYVIAKIISFSWILTEILPWVQLSFIRRSSKKFLETNCICTQSREQNMKGTGPFHELVTN